MLPSGYNFTERVRRIADEARDVAARLGHAAIDPLHIAVALIRDDGVAATALRFHGTDLEQVDAELQRMLREYAAQATESPELSSDAQTLLSQAAAEAREMKHPYVGTEHLLLAMLRNASAPTARALGRDGLGFSEARARIDWILTADRDDPRPFASPPA